RELVALVGVIYQEPSIACGEPHGRKEGPGDSHSEDERPIIKHVGCSVLEGVCAARRAPAQRRAPAASRAAAPTAAPTTATRGGKAEGIEEWITGRRPAGGVARITGRTVRVAGRITAPWSASPGGGEGG